MLALLCHFSKVLQKEMDSLHITCYQVAYTLLVRQTGIALANLVL